MLKKMAIVVLCSLMSLSSFVVTHSNQDGVNSVRALSNGYKEKAANIIGAVKTDYSNNFLMNAIVSRNIADVKTGLKNVKNIDEQFSFWVKFSGFDGVIWNGELQEKMNSDQTYLSLALLNSTFDSTEKERENSLSIIQLLLEAHAKNIMLTHAYFLKKADGLTNDYVGDMSVFGWAIFCECDEKIIKVLLDSNFVTTNLMELEAYKTFAQDLGSQALLNLLDNYIKKASQGAREKKQKREHRSKRNSGKRAGKSTRRNCRSCSR